ncbi:MAG: glycosyltransferase family 2 protein [Pseudomonadales bacterium]|nr:glycosyltransferase family 2 protein [Pseudomonadales bacterium]
MTQVRATATIIALNESDNIADCVASVSFFDEVLVIDSGSTDGTRALAESVGARVLENPWPGYGQQKQFALENASHDWIFSLDADERVSPELRASITGLLEGRPDAQGYVINRRNHFMGRALRHGEGYPDWCLRLFNRQSGHWTLDPVHERVDLKGKVDRLEGDLDHFSEGSLEEYLQKQNQYTTLQARQLYARGRRFSMFKLTTSPIVRFFKFYIFRLGFLDGIPGLVHISIGCFNSFCKYAKLRELQNNPPPSCR